MEFVCLQDSEIICTLCRETSHQGHWYKTVNEFYQQQKLDIGQLLDDSTSRVAKLLKAIDDVTAEKQALDASKERMGNEIRNYFAEIFKQLNQQQNALLEEVENLVSKKQKILHNQLNGLQSSTNTIMQASQQLQETKDSDQINGIILMGQLVTQLESAGDTREPIELADLAFYGKPVTCHAQIVDSIHHARVENPGDFPLVVKAYNRNDHQVPISKNTFTITAEDKNKQHVELKLSQKNGGLEIQPEIFTVETLRILMNDAHIEGSPVKFEPLQYSWADTGNKNTIVTGKILTALTTGGWGRIKQEFAIHPHNLTVKIHHHDTGNWCQITLYESSTFKHRAGFRPTESALAYYRPEGWSDKSIKGKVTTLRLQRGHKGMISLFVDEALQWQKSIGVCYVYVDVHDPTVQAEIV